MPKHIKISLTENELKTVVDALQGRSKAFVIPIMKSETRLNELTSKPYPKDEYIEGAKLRHRKLIEADRKHRKPLEKLISNIQKQVSGNKWDW